MYNKLRTTNQNSKLALSKAKNLIGITNKVLSKKSGGAKWQFWLQNDTSLSRIQRHAIDSEYSVLIYYYYSFLKHDAMVCLLKRAQRNSVNGQKSLIICKSEVFKYLVLEKISYNTNNIEIELINEVKSIDLIKGLYNEILIHDLHLSDVSINTLRMLKKSALKVSCSVENAISFNNHAEEEILDLFSNSVQYDLDDVSISSYEIYRFAIQFVPYNARANDERLLDRLKQKNSGVDKPFVFIAQTFEDEIKNIKEVILENPVYNILIVLPYGQSDENYDISVDKYYKELSKSFYCSKYYDGLKINELYHVLLTTFEHASDFESEYMILPQFEISRQIVEYETIFNTLCSVKYQLHMFQKENDYSNELVEIVKL